MEHENTLNLSIILFDNATEYWMHTLIKDKVLITVIFSILAYDFRTTVCQISFWQEVIGCISRGGDTEV